MELLYSGIYAEKIASAIPSKASPGIYTKKVLNKILFCRISGIYTKKMDARIPSSFKNGIGRMIFFV